MHETIILSINLHLFVCLTPQLSINNQVRAYKKCTRPLFKVCNQHDAQYASPSPEQLYINCHGVGCAALEIHHKFVGDLIFTVHDFLDMLLEMDSKDEIAHNFMVNSLTTWDRCCRASLAQACSCQQIVSHVCAQQQRTAAASQRQSYILRPVQT